MHIYYESGRQKRKSRNKKHTLYSLHFKRNEQIRYHIYTICTLIRIYLFIGYGVGLPLRIRNVYKIALFFMQHTSRKQSNQCLFHVQVCHTFSRHQSGYHSKFKYFILYFCLHLRVHARAHVACTLSFQYLFVGFFFILPIRQGREISLKVISSLSVYKAISIDYATNQKISLYNCRTNF